MNEPGRNANMTASEQRENWERIDALFSRVLERPPDERLGYLESLQDIDRELRRAVERLLEDHRSAEGFLESPLTLPSESLEAVVASLGHDPFDRPAAWEDNRIEEADVDVSAASPGECIGAWRVMRELGRGGMATVYLVERADAPYEQTAALKLLRRGLDTADLVARFEAERRILSSLSHPGIAVLLDGGATVDGRPYLVMELVEGISITDWCKGRNASIDDRLQLFVDVARVVHHAHSRLIVHRDIKPSNILVTTDGRVNLLDFGIAKILDPGLFRGAEARTRTGRQALTPGYASPEQVRGEAVTTSTDVYQLGLLLHRLLSGARPADIRGPAGRFVTDPTPTPRLPSHVARALESEGAEGGTVTPEHLSRRLSGDLDAIVMKALESDPEQRYGSVLGMAEDVERHLRGLPITARPAGQLYRLRKFLGRHRWVAPTAALGVLAAVAYVGTLIRHQGQLEGERNAARAEAVRAERIRDVLVGVFRGADPWSAEDPREVSQASIVSALDIGTRRARKELADEPELQADILASIADVYAGRDDLESASQLLEEAIALGSDVGGRASVELAAHRLKLAAVYNRQTRYDTAATLARRSLAALQDRPVVPDTLVVRALREVGYAEKGLGRYAEMERYLVAASERLAGIDGPPPGLHALVARDLGLLYAYTDRPDEARTIARQQYAVTLEAFGREDLRTARAGAQLAEVLWITLHVGFDEAVRLQSEAHRIFESILGPDHRTVLRQRTRLALMLRTAGHLDEAEAELRDLWARYERIFGENDLRTASVIHNLAMVLYTAGALAESDRVAQKAQRIREAGGEKGLGGLAGTLVVRCGGRLHSGDPGSAEALCRRAIVLFEDLGVDQASIMHGAKCRLAGSLQAQGEIREVASLLEDVLEPMWMARKTHTPGDVRHCFETLAAAYQALDRSEEAMELRQRVADLSRRGLPGAGGD